MQIKEDPASKLVYISAFHTEKEDGSIQTTRKITSSTFAKITTLIAWAFGKKETQRKIDLLDGEFSKLTSPGL
jgi:hypothetical protein